jgi:hypothetical protein
MPGPLNTLVRLLLCLAVVGCSPRDTSAPAAPAASATIAAPTPSPGGSCPGAEVQVTINQVSIAASGASMQVNPGARSIAPSGAGVRWKFSQNTYAFTSDGITFKPNQPAGPASAPATGDPTQFLWCFGSTDSAPNSVWQYNIKFASTSAPSAVWVCDPTIINASTIDADAAMLTVNCTPG